ncbi:hypothetical protein [Dyadobacter bucti]|uniref:hypothetical protein n=1 Tax=Dyadobacter bucti TaxID=2572203 RepID=UPI001107B31F|nr:hypothetical protein [Dyadobacter bucti]
MDDLVLQIINACIQQRKDSGLTPHHVTLINLDRSIKDSLNRLYSAGKIKVGDTINDKYIDVL